MTCRNFESNSTYKKEIYTAHKVTSFTKLLDVIFPDSATLLFYITWFLLRDTFTNIQRKHKYQTLTKNFLWQNKSWTKEIFADTRNPICN